MQSKKILVAVLSTISITAYADNSTSFEQIQIQEAIKLLEEKGYQVGAPINDKETFTGAKHISSIQTGNFDAFISGEFSRTRYKLKNYSLSDYASPINDGSYSVRTSFAYQDPSKLGLQLDGVYAEENMDAAVLTTLDLAAHAFYRNDRFLLGLFGQYKQPSLSHKNILSDFSADLFIAQQAFWGAESQAYFGNLTITGQLARQEFVNQSDLNFFKHGNVAALKANYFVNDNWKFITGYGYNNVNLSGGLDYDNHKLSVGTEYRFSNYPLSIYADYTHNKFSLESSTGAGDTNLSTDAIMLGIKINFGSESLIIRDRTGASLNPINNRGYSDYWEYLMAKGSLPSI